MVSVLLFICILSEVVRMDVLPQLGFGKSLATNCVWLEGVEKTMSRKFLVGQLSRYGQVLWCDIDRETHRAIVYMESQDVAAVTIASLKERAVAGVTLQVTILLLLSTLTFFPSRTQIQSLHLIVTSEILMSKCHRFSILVYIYMID
jgi:hypothetical protein